MHKLALAIIASTTLLTAFAPLSANAGTVACEDLRTQLDTAMLTKNPADADKATFEALIVKGDERCKSEDDRRADEFYNQALALLPK